MTWNNPKPWAAEVITHADRPLDYLGKLFSQFFNEHSFRKNLDQFNNESELSLIGLYAYTRSIGRFYNHTDGLTIGEVAFVASRNPYVVSNVEDFRRYTDDGDQLRADLVIACKLFRTFDEDYCSLAWFSLLCGTIPPSEFGNYRGLDFDTAVKYFEGGTTHGEDIKKMMGFTIDSELARATVTGSL